jgi:hypothetical protein
MAREVQHFERAYGIAFLENELGLGCIMGIVFVYGDLCIGKGSSQAGQAGQVVKMAVG